MNFCRQLLRVAAGTMDAVIEWERGRAFQRRVRRVISGEEKNRNRGYVALGKHYYKNLRAGSDDGAARLLCENIDRSQSREQAARGLLMRRREAGSVAIIGGADGPTAIYVASSPKKQRKTAD